MATYYEKERFHLKEVLEMVSSIRGKICEMLETRGARPEGCSGASLGSSVEPSSAWVCEAHAPCCTHTAHAPHKHHTSTVLGAAGTERTKELSASKETFGLMGQVGGGAAHFYIIEYYQGVRTGCCENTEGGPRTLRRRGCTSAVRHVEE